MGIMMCTAAVLFGLIALILTLLGEKGAMIVGGFNNMPKAKRDEYDKKRISRDQRNFYLRLSLIMVFGLLVSYFVTEWAAAVAWIAWLISFLRMVDQLNKDIKTDFERYKKQHSEKV